MKVSSLSKPQKFITGGVLILTVAMITGGGLHHALQAWHQKQARQADVAAKGALVMPFDLEQTIHRFEPQKNGGLQTVVARDPQNQTQIGLIQAHLKEEATKFQAGDFSDPATIHGSTMPGLSALSAGYSAIKVSYRATPAGAQIRYTAQSEALVVAIHDWFAAQRSDHGRHAH